MPIISQTQYLTEQGDWWDMISKRVYGTEIYMNILTDANPQYNSTAIFDAGVTLSTPVLSTAKSVFGLPPWKTVVQVA